MAEFRSYRDLIVWQLAMELAKQVYVVTASFPKDELYGLTSQLRRCSVSIPSNIAEGHARESSKEFLHHVSIALGSLAELETQVTLSGNFHYISPSMVGELLAAADQLGRKLRGLQKSIRAKVTP
jgi:four helix bundle protein